MACAISAHPANNLCPQTPNPHSSLSQREVTPSRLVSFPVHLHTNALRRPFSRREYFPSSDTRYRSIRLVSRHSSQGFSSIGRKQSMAAVRAQSAADSAGVEWLEITQPDDWHLHVRDGAALQSVVPFSAAVFHRAVIMPNLRPPVTTALAAAEYRERVLAAVPEGRRGEEGFKPLMTLYLTDDTTPEEVQRAKDGGLVVAFKLYPAGATTNSAAGVTDLFGRCFPAIEHMAHIGMPLLHVPVHSLPLSFPFPLPSPSCMEKWWTHQSTCSTARRKEEHRTQSGTLQMWPDEGPTEREQRDLCGTHCSLTLAMLWNRNVLFAGGIRPLPLAAPRHLLPKGSQGLYPHDFCLPVLKRETHCESLRALPLPFLSFALPVLTETHCNTTPHSLLPTLVPPAPFLLTPGQAIVAAVTGGSTRFFLGTDSAPHERTTKEAPCGCAGIFSAHAALPLYARAFEQAGALDKLEAFTSFNGPDFYGLPRNSRRITLIRQPWAVPDLYPYGEGNGSLVPMLAGEQLDWQVLPLDS
ncbi:unnamed protein product [Closterium sp. NIES-54]